MKSRLQEKYRSETVPALMKRFGWKNMMAVPKLKKITVNIGLGEASQNAKLLDTAAVELGQITGQKAVITRAKKSIANFKIRKGMPIGCAVTLRGDLMYEFLDRLCNVVLPRVRDFRGLPQNSFDGRGNYTLGLKDQLVFPEIDYTRVDKIKGMNITMTTSARNDEQAPQAGADEHNACTAAAAEYLRFEPCQLVLAAGRGLASAGDMRFGPVIALRRPVVYFRKTHFAQGRVFLSRLGRYSSRRAR